MDCPSLQPVDWTIKINKKERRLAVATALQSAATDITVEDDIKVRILTCSLFPLANSAEILPHMGSSEVFLKHVVVAGRDLATKDFDVGSLPGHQGYCQGAEGPPYCGGIDTEPCAGLSQSARRDVDDSRPACGVRNTKSRQDHH